MRFDYIDNALTLYLVGEINSATAPTIDREIDGIIAKKKITSLVLDFDEVTYLSSAGLRIVLRLKQKYGEVSIVNASLEVYDVLSMTGFTTMMTVQRKLAEIDVSNAELIGEGFFSLVYRIDKDTIIKVFRQHTALSEVERELNLAKQAFVLGIPTAISFDVVKVGDRLGVRFEMLDCASLRDVFRDHPERYDEMLHKYADLLTTINTTEPMDPTLPDIKAAWISKGRTCRRYLDDAHYAKLMDLLSGIEDRQTFVHGDCHYKNIMVQGEELLLIDMDTLSRGHPIFELASIYAPYVAFEESDEGNTQRFMGISAEFTQKMFHDLLALYFGKEDESYFKKIGLVAYAHMIWWNQANTPDNHVRHEVCLKKLIALLDEVEDLDIGK